ncbi:hypothetical protein [Mycobacterium sp.]|uniref:hypothetical protein n=1 Tax=Mycobacterium sp. TaxID=1785 RepID=UPI003D0BBFA1
MKAAVRLTLLAVSLAGMAAPATLIVGPALPGHLVTTQWVLAQARIEAFVIVVPKCKREARHYRRDPDYVPLERCLNSRYFQGLTPPGDAPPPPEDAPPPPPGDAPPPGDGP